MGWIYRFDLAEVDEALACHRCSVAAISRQTATPLPRS
jgi:hypothetical protein